MIVRFNSDGTTRKTRSSSFEPIRLSDDEARDPSEVAAAILKISTQLSNIVRMVPAEIREYEVVISPGTSQAVRLPHALGNSVRYWVAEWTSGDPFPSVRRDSTNSDSNTLALTVTTTGVTANSTMVIRVEPSV